MKSIRARNLRSFSNDNSQPFIDLKPITVFVGKNSCGKSSLLRTLPMLRQSIESRTSGPFLWYGTYVDYGSFSEAKNKNSKQSTITFDYKFDIAIPSPFGSFNKNPPTPVELELSVSEKKRATIAHSLKLKVSDVVFEVSFLNEKPSLVVNGQKINTNFVHLSARNGVLPTITIDNFNPSDDFALDCFSQEVDQDEIDQLLFEYDMQGAISRQNILNIINIIKPRSTFIGDDISFESHVINNLGFMSRSSMKAAVEKQFQLLEPLTRNEQQTIYFNSLIAFFPKIIDRVNSHLAAYAKNIRYIAPLRATAERFYRFQDLRVEELDHTGSNLAMLLRNMAYSEMKRFQRWCLDNFGFTVSVPESQSLHYEIVININEQETNISDMGFGFSQILPIITMLWLDTQSRLSPARRRRTHSIPLTFVIEQPELHLHPEFQATLAKVFASIAHKATSQLNIQIIFETHSKTMIDAIGDYIEKHDCPEIANIYIFDKEDNSTNVHISGFDEDGDLVNWPLGFFSGR